MKNDGQDFLEKLADSTPETFEERFELWSNRLDLGRWFSRNESILLYEAALRAVLCNVALNGTDPNATGHPDAERFRRSREIDFLEARDILFASPGWQALPLGEQSRLANAFLAVRVMEHKFRW